MEQGLGLLFITSSGFYFFNKTNLEQYLIKKTYHKPFFMWRRVNSIQCITSLPKEKIAHENAPTCVMCNPFLSFHFQLFHPFFVL